MTRYTFDIKLFATAYVDAEDEYEARRILADFSGFDELGQINPRLSVGGAYTDGEADLADEEEIAA